jgi:hypothetical protein
MRWGLLAVAAAALVVTAMLLVTSRDTGRQTQQQLEANQDQLQRLGLSVLRCWAPSAASSRQRPPPPARDEPCGTEGPAYRRSTGYLGQQGL